MMKKKYVLFLFLVLIIDNHHLCPSNSRPPVHPGKTVAQQDEEAVLRAIQSCSLKQSLAQARTLCIKADFTEEESRMLTEDYKEPPLAEQESAVESIGRSDQKFFVEDAWSHLARHTDKPVGHSAMLSPEQVKRNNDTSEEARLTVQDIVDEDL